MTGMPMRRSHQKLRTKLPGCSTCVIAHAPAMVRGVLPSAGSAGHSAWSSMLQGAAYTL